jgi:hypothetical protein
MVPLKHFFMKGKILCRKEMIFDKHISVETSWNDWCDVDSSTIIIFHKCCHMNQVVRFYTSQPFEWQQGIFTLDRISSGCLISLPYFSFDSPQSQWQKIFQEAMCYLTFPENFHPCCSEKKRTNCQYHLKRTKGIIWSTENEIWSEGNHQENYLWSIMARQWEYNSNATRTKSSTSKNLFGQSLIIFRREQ